jgi:hypothetical protein
MTFSALLKGERFHFVTATGIVLPEVYTKIAAGICKDADGQWLNVRKTLTVEPVKED